MSDDDRKLMGTPEDAAADLASRTATWRRYRQPVIGTAAEHRRNAVLEKEALFQLGNAALLWLWHRENPLPSADAEATRQQQVEARR